MNKRTIFKVAIVISTMALSSCNLMPNLMPNSRANSSYEDIDIQTSSEKPDAKSSEDNIISSIHQHEWGEWVETKSPTCMENGLEERTCAICGQKETSTLLKIDHQYGEWTILYPATCTENGREERYCTMCNRREAKVIPANGSHEWGEWYVVKAPTCSEYGIERRQCSVCAVTEDREIERTTNHEWGEWEVIKAPTCSEYGIERRRCAVCSIEESREIDRLSDHVWGEWEEVIAATCYASGRQMRRCAICGLEENKEIPKTEHQFVQEEDRTIMPTCEQDGTKFYICSICHEEYIESIPALGHDWSFWSTVREANCHEEGLKERYCMRSGCGAKESDLIAKTSHLWGEWEIAKVATCVAGEKQRMCSICGDVEKQVIPMDPSAGHVWTEWQVTKTPSCSKGQEKRVCQNCGIEEFRDIPATLDSEHIWGEPMVVEDIYDADGVTLLKAGYKMIQCSVCGTMRLEMETAKATLDPILTKDGDVLYKDNEPVMSKFKIETANSADNEDEKINVGVKLDKYSGFSSSDNAAYHGSFSFKFDFDREADVAIYQRGCMDSFSGNKQRTYYSGADMDNYTYANFEFDVNGEPIDLYEQRNVRYCDVVEERDPYDYNDPLRNSGYSTFGEFYIGESQIVAGENTFTYKRLASYNLVTTYIILEVSFPDHIHEAERDAEWVNTDSDYHWKNCKEGDGYKLGKARHDFGEAYIEIEPTCTCDGLAHKMCKVCGYSYDIVVPALGHDFGEIIVDVAPTCTEKGFGHRICKRCESIVDEEIATTGHNWDEGTTIYNSEGKAVIPLTCSCGKVGAKMAVSDYSSASFTSTTGTDGDIQYKFDKNSDNVWKINAPKAGTYEIRVSAKIDASNKNHTLSDSPVTVKVGNISYEVSTATFAELGVGTSKIAEFVLVPEAYFEEGENTITISQGSGGYRLTYGGDIVICEI